LTLLLTGNTIRLRYRDQPVNAVLGKQSVFIVRTIRNTQIQSVPHRTHYVSATEPNRLMLFGETVAVCCENHKEDKSIIRISQETLRTSKSRLQNGSTARSGSPMRGETKYIQFKFFALKFQKRIKIIGKYFKLPFECRGLNSPASERSLLHIQ
jgi:hypothetical protein